MERKRRKEKLEIKKKEKMRGITLIALVITIIVLLILAGVSIAMLTGENGLLTQAENAKTQTEKSGVEESVDIAMAEYYTRKNAGENITLGDFLNEKVEAGEFDNVTDNGEGTYTVEKDGYEVIVSDDGRQGDAQKAGPRPTVENVKVVVNSDGTGENLAEGSQEEGTKLYINFETKIEGGEITEVTCDNGTEVKETNGTYTMEVSKNGEYKFTIIGEVDGEEYTTEYTVEVNQYDNSLKIGDYVEYNVSYTDMETDYNFTAKDGWRVLDPGKDNGDGTYTGLKLISTGMPVQLYYAHYAIKNIEKEGTTVGKWAGNTTQRENYKNQFYVPSNDDINNENMYAAAGLYYNFGLIKIQLKPGSGVYSNVGMYKELMGKTSGDINGEEFIVNGVAEEVHNLTLAELNEARKSSDLESTNGTQGNEGAKGLFYLKGLEDYGYSSASPHYWLASPGFNSTQGLYFVAYNGQISDIGSNGAIKGLRPVISLSSDYQIKKVEK